MTGRLQHHRELLCFGALALIALVAALLLPTFPNYDAYYHLQWGRELLGATRPSFAGYMAPTEHPLYLAVATVLAGFGGGDRGLVLFTVICFVALLWGVFRLARACFDAPTGVCATVLVGSSLALLLYAARAYVDVPFLAVVVWAAALEAERRRRGVAVVALLALAGLLRPEAWLLAGAYWLWCARAWSGRRRIAMAAVAVLPPAIWFSIDRAVTGDWLWSLHATGAQAEELHRVQGALASLTSLPLFLAIAIGLPLVVLGLIGLGLALRRGGRESAAVPLVLVAFSLVGFLVLGALQFSLLPRYLILPAVLLCVFAAYALLGFRQLGVRTTGRRLWSAGSVAVVAVGAVFFGTHLNSQRSVASELTAEQVAHRDLNALLKRPAVRTAMRCGPVTFPSYKLVPEARWIANSHDILISSRSARRHQHGVEIFILGADALRRFAFAAGVSPRTNIPDDGYTRMQRVGMFSAYESC